MAEDAWYEVFAEIIEDANLTTAGELVGVLASACSRVGLDVTLYLADIQQHVLRPVTGGEELDVDGSLAGRAFRFSQLVASPQEHGGAVLWVPVIDGTERLGAARFRLPAGADPEDPDLRARCRILGMLTGHLIAGKLASGDLFHRVRRTAPYSVSSELLWQLLPPRTFAHPGLVISVVMEPYDQVGGDGYDYAVDDHLAYLAVFDSTGHDLHAGLLTTTALAATRNARRGGAGLEAITDAADAALAGHAPLKGFTTAVLATLDLATGTLHYLLAGHPPPVLLRSGSAVKVAHPAPRPPLGVPRRSPATGLGTMHLEPGDRLLLYSDGITEARSPDRRFFGLDRLVDLTERHEAAGLTAPETVRRIIHAVLEHQHGQLQDDATLLLLEWSTSRPTGLLPSH
ncbi:PP2C family protein-serine/threonine phosphatase [Amycolatopsis cynarae]|uniref:PP2C family protein-serine/threonine phosphatase n=1 Tax=Amycolatopsis cynarae TaxID=2995223 RepID=A0ABY7BAG6_9PSEU|nr:PP2C family protein-serine/threonine phosphatase [Amycolatopsis sp. HUAS 11-8]WAL69349.1 PP2C family protein-serine/threonine phosphatase [Amycolatopsis sp. HUAS 11-8]